jgi:hypothetical protein
LTIASPALTVRINVALELPSEFVAVIVYVALEVSTNGAPDSNPVLVLKVRPEGALGEIE